MAKNKPRWKDLPFEDRFEKTAGKKWHVKGKCRRMEEDT